MTSIMNLDARYHFSYDEWTGLYYVYYESKIIGQSFSKDECVFWAKQHNSKQE